MELEEDKIYSRKFEKGATFVCLTICSAFIFELSRVPSSYGPMFTDKLFSALLGGLLLLSMPFYLIYFLWQFFNNKSLTKKHKLSIIASHLLITAIGYLILYYAFTPPVIAHFKEITTEVWLDYPRKKRIPIYQNEQLGYYFMVLGYNLYWLYQIIKREKEEILYSAKLLPILIALIILITDKYTHTQRPIFDPQ